jgi:hypothetical protein
MSNIMPEGDSIRRAVQYISDGRKYNSEKKPADLVHEACLKYDLSPAEAEYLNRLILEGAE